MENRRLDKKLTDYNYADDSLKNSRNKEEVLNSLQIVGEKLRIAINSKSIDNVATFIISDKNTVSLEFQNKDEGFVFLNINNKDICFGFTLKFLGLDLPLLNSKEVEAIKKRYFSNLDLINLPGEITMVKSEFKVSRKQLNSRDFIEYSSFILEKALRMRADLLEYNKQEFSIAV